MGGFQDCGGPPDFWNVCYYDACTTGKGVGKGGCDDGKVCLEAGVFSPENRCVVAACASDDDCTGGTNGACKLMGDPCRSHGTNGYVCVYDESECREDDDCGDRQVCAFDEDAGATKCQYPPPHPPTPAPTPTPVEFMSVNV